MGSHRWTFRRALLAGTLAGVVVIAAIAAYVFATGGLRPAHAGADDVIVVLILPDEDGVAIPRTIARYAAIAPAALHVDPLTPAKIAGTGYDTLRDAYPFGGGSGLASALHGATPPPPGAAASGPRPAYVLVDRDALIALATLGGMNARLTLDNPEHMEVFDGSAMYTFTEGSITVDPADLPALFNGAEYLTEADRESLRVQVAGEIVSRLVSAPGSFDSVETDLSAEEFATWLAAVAPNH